MLVLEQPRSSPPRRRLTRVRVLRDARDEPRLVSRLRERSLELGRKLRDRHDARALEADIITTRGAMSSLAAAIAAVPPISTSEAELDVARLAASSHAASVTGHAQSRIDAGLEP
jgi:hypothetical protein